MRNNLFAVFVFSLSLCAARAQTNAPEPVIPPSINTNLVTGLGLVDFAMMIWPAMDPTLTNTFGAGEIEFGVGPAWKAVGAVGSTPYLDIRGGYMFSRHLGIDVDVVTLGSGSGQADIDSTSLLLKARADRGNVAAYAILGPDREFTLGNWAGRFGVGLEYRYKTKISIATDTSYIAWGTGAKEGGWLHCLRLNYGF